METIPVPQSEGVKTEPVVMKGGKWKPWALDWQKVLNQIGYYEVIDPPVTGESGVIIQHETRYFLTPTHEVIITHTEHKTTAADEITGRPSIYRYGVHGRYPEDALGGTNGRIELELDHETDEEKPILKFDKIVASPIETIQQ